MSTWINIYVLRMLFKISTMRTWINIYVLRRLFNITAMKSWINNYVLRMLFNISTMRTWINIYVLSLPLVQDIKATNQGFRFVSRCWLTRIDNLNLLHKKVQRPKLNVIGATRWNVYDRSQPNWLKSSLQ